MWKLLVGPDPQVLNANTDPTNQTNSESARIQNTRIRCCGSGIQCLLDPWIRDPEKVFSGSRISDPKQIFLRA
jgi:hypothetical protein